MASILVLGAGELGLSVLTSLATHPQRHETKLAVLVRQQTLSSSAPKITHLRTLNVHFECADVVTAPTATLAALFSRYHTVVSCSGMTYPPGTQTKLLQAALQGGVRRYFPWQFGMDYDVIGQGSSQDLFDEQLQVREGLKGQDATEWTIVSTGLFMSFLFQPDFGVVDLQEGVVRALGAWESSITVTHPTDIGRVTAEIVLAGEGRNAVLFVAGETVTYAQVADSVDDVTRGKVRRELWDLEELQRQMVTEGSTMVKYRDTFARGRGVAWDVAGTVNERRGMRMMGVKEYLERLVRGEAE